MPQWCDHEMEGLVLEAISREWLESEGDDESIHADKVETFEKRAFERDRPDTNRRAFERMSGENFPM